MFANPRISGCEDVQQVKDLINTASQQSILVNRMFDRKDQHDMSHKMHSIMKATRGMAKRLDNPENFQDVEEDLDQLQHDIFWFMSAFCQGDAIMQDEIYMKVYQPIFFTKELFY